MTTDDTTGGDSDAREAAVELLKAGELAPSDIAHLAGVDRQVVHYWIKAAKIDPAKAYQARITRQWRRSLDAIKGKPSRKKRTKAELRAEANKAVAAFNRKRDRRE